MKKRQGARGDRNVGVYRTSLCYDCDSTRRVSHVMCLSICWT